MDLFVGYGNRIIGQRVKTVTIFSQRIHCKNHYLHVPYKANKIYTVPFSTHEFISKIFDKNQNIAPKLKCSST